jgi:hypothetical protein
MLRDNLFLASLGLLIFLVLAVLGLVLYLAIRRSNTKAANDPKIARLRFDSLRNSFRQAVELIETNIASRGERYSIPWVLVLNEGANSGQLPIEQSGVASALSPPKRQWPLPPRACPGISSTGALWLTSRVPISDRPTMKMRPSGHGTSSWACAAATARSGRLTRS